MDIDPKELIGAAGPQGLRRLCTDHKRCGLGAVCEHAQIRGDQSVNLVSAWTPPMKHGECGNYFPRTELGSTMDVPRRSPGQPKTNEHAPRRKN